MNPSETVKKDIKYRMYLARARDQVDVSAYPAPSNGTIYNIPMLAGQYMTYIDCRTNSVKPNAASAGEVAKVMTLTVTADIEGLSKTMLQWLYANNGEKFFIIWEYCITGQKFIAGSSCSPMKLSVTRLGTDDDWTGASLSFESTCPDPFYFFDGNIPRETPTQLAANSTSLTVSTAQQYLVPNNTANTTITTLSGVTSDMVGRIIDLIGDGSTYPSTIAPSASFILRNGANFIASGGSRISFEIIKTGASTFALLEVARN